MDYYIILEQIRIELGYLVSEEDVNIVVNEIQKNIEQRTKDEERKSNIANWWLEAAKLKRIEQLEQQKLVKTPQK